MRIIVAGSRNFNDYKLLQEKLDHILQNVESPEIVSGHARGTDQLGERYAVANGMVYHVFPAQWRKYGRRAGLIRNQQMADFADALIAFYPENRESRGTADMIDKARQKGLSVRVIYIKEV